MSFEIPMGGDPEYLFDNIPSSNGTFDDSSESETEESDEPESKD